MSDIEKRGRAIAEANPYIFTVIGMLADLNKTGAHGKLRICRLDKNGEIIGQHHTDEIDFSNGGGKVLELVPRPDEPVDPSVVAGSRYRRSFRRN